MYIKVNISKMHVYSGHRYCILLVIRGSIYTLASTLTKALIDSLTVKHCHTVTKQIYITIMHHHLPYSCSLFLVRMYTTSQNGQYQGLNYSRHCGYNLIPDIVTLSYISLLQQMIFNSKPYIAGS